jgi:uncharacterized membrane protein YdjX (TVP38/TMEM64 family)
MSLAGGYLFGALLGGLAALGACVAGSIVVFLACRTAFGDWAARRAGPRLKAVQARFATNALGAVTMLRLIPMLPISATTLAAGLGGAPLSALALGTLIGTAPVSFIFAGLGSGLHDVLDTGGRIDAHLFAQPKIMLSLAGLTLLAAAPLVWRMLRPRRS